MKKLFWLLMPYFNKRYYPGNGVRWIIQDEKRKTPYCFCCGNYANGVAIITLGKHKINLPICVPHVKSWHEKHTHADWEFVAPGAVTIHPKFLS